MEKWMTHKELIIKATIKHFESERDVAVVLDIFAEDYEDV